MHILSTLKKLLRKKDSQTRELASSKTAINQPSTTRHKFQKCNPNTHDAKSGISYNTRSQKEKKMS